MEDSGNDQRWVHKNGRGVVRGRSVLKKNGMQVMWRLGICEYHVQRPAKSLCLLRSRGRASNQGTGVVLGTLYSS